MATIDRPSSGVPFARTRALVERLWRPIAVQRPAVRWGLAAAAFLAVGAASYWGAGSLSTSGVRYLASSKRFSSDDLLKICHALDKQRIVYRIDDLKRVEVAGDQFDQAADVVAKLDLGQRPIDVIRDDSGSGSLFWDGPGEREQKEKLKLERMLERLISEQSGVLRAVVSINRPRPSTFARNSATKPSAFVYVETDGGRALPSRSVQAILSLLEGFIPGLVPESITVMDHRSTRYLDPANLALSDHSRDRAREEEIAEEILDKLDWIKGVRVQVRVMTPHAGEAAVMAGRAGAAAKGAGSGEHHAEPGRVGAWPGEERSSASPPLMAVNRPLAVDADAEPSPTPPPGSVGAPSMLAAAAKSQGSRRTGESPKERGRVLINVPRSFYVNMEIRNDKGEPSPDELRTMEERTEKSIRMAVALLLPDADSWKVEIGRIADDVSLSRPAILPGVADSRQRLLEWAMVGVLGAGVSILAIAGSWIRMARRPARLPEPSDRSRRYHVGSALEPSPSERVRELIQRNPEAAASVLQRWVGQGGRSA